MELWFIKTKGTPPATFPKGLSKGQNRFQEIISANRIRIAKKKSVYPIDNELLMSVPFSALIDAYY